MNKTLVMERRFFSVDELRVSGDGDDGAVLTGYAAVFDTLSLDLGGFREKIAPGAFTESLDGDVRALWNHDANHVLGRTKSGTLTLGEDSHGLHVEIKPPAAAAGFVESIRRGDVDQMSFGFRAISDDWTEDENGVTTRTLLIAELFDVSPVTFPAYPATDIGVRNDIYGYIPDIADHVRMHLTEIAENKARTRLRRNRNKLELIEREHRT